MCRGFDRDEYDRTHGGYDATGNELLPDTLPAKMSPDRDRLVCYATTEGHMALMDPEKGSVFIQTLTKVLWVCVWVYVHMYACMCVGGEERGGGEECTTTTINQKCKKENSK